tara:strand:- start:940 stop:1428 length:489 start_codon:yes stop_codon:yes gene_type:complete
MASKKPTAKQIAARKKFAATMKSGGFKKKKTKAVKKAAPKKRKTTTTKRKTVTIKRTPVKRKTMARRRTRIVRSARKGGMRIGSSLKTGTIGEIVKGIGAGSLATMVVGRVAPQYAPIASIGAGFLTGGVIGGAANLILNGGMQSLGGIFGGASTPAMENGV